jgi:Predicted pyridoxal phosphate-dependent enzyme apparently involved in regulation of cell wall biogenesis
MGEKIYLASPHMSDEGFEMAYIKEAFSTNWIAPLGPNVNEFEKEFASKVGVRYAAALNTGTAAIHLALRAVGVGEGDIVFCPTLTFSATVNPIIYEKAIPVFMTVTRKLEYVPTGIRRSFPEISQCESCDCRSSLWFIG